MVERGREKVEEEVEVSEKPSSKRRRQEAAAAAKEERMLANRPLFFSHRTATLSYFFFD